MQVHGFPVEDFRFGLFMDDGLCISLQTSIFVFGNLLLPLFVDNIIISIYIINWNCVVVFVIVSFIIDLLDLHFHIFGDRRGHDRMVVGFTTTCVISAFHHPLKLWVRTLFIVRCTRYNIMIVVKFVSDLW